MADIVSDHEYGSRRRACRVGSSQFSSHADALQAPGSFVRQPGCAAVGKTACGHTPSQLYIGRAFIWCAHWVRTARGRSCMKAKKAKSRPNDAIQDRCVSKLSVYDESMPQAPYRRPIMQFLLTLTAVFGVLFAVLNYRQADYGLMALEIVMSVFALPLLTVVSRTQRLQLWIVVFLLAFFGVMMYALTTAKVVPTVFAWVLLIPILSYLLLGRWLGACFAGFFLSASGVIFFSQYGFELGYTELRSVANVVLVSICIFGFSHVYETSREHAESRLRAMALTDPLTGLPNRARLREVFEAGLSRYERHSAPMALLMLDLDHFKDVNDRYGHDAGDAVLRFVAQVMRARLRPSDMACRIGGEEFCVVLVDTNRAQAIKAAEDLCGQVRTQRCIHRGHEISLSTSIGIAEIGVDGIDLDRLLRVADKRLYEAKTRGRDCVVA
ncbi:GGDEF domain-containing protein [Salinisphaera shabanensis]|uniref:GGDEF domain-containing protein n=1 Tax=Salinisphaera shabanensis TaxID=180542 RepID=UPI00333E7AA5